MQISTVNPDRIIWFQGFWMRSKLLEPSSSTMRRHLSQAVTQSALPICTRCATRLYLLEYRTASNRSLYTSKARGEPAQAAAALSESQLQEQPPARTSASETRDSQRATRTWQPLQKSNIRWKPRANNNSGSQNQNGEVRTAPFIRKVAFDGNDNAVRERGNQGRQNNWKPRNQEPPSNRNNWQENFASRRASLRQSENREGQDSPRDWQHVRRRNNAPSGSSTRTNYRQSQDFNSRPMSDGAFVGFVDEAPKTDPFHSRRRESSNDKNLSRHNSRNQDRVRGEQRQNEVSGKKMERRRAQERRRTAMEDEDDLDEEYDEEGYTKYERKKMEKERRRAQKAAQAKEAKELPTILLPEYISIVNLASALKVRVEAFSRKLQELGFEDTGSDYIIDAETAGLIASEFGFEPLLPSAAESEDLVALPEPEDKSSVPSRPPIVTIMGHVDHGKTTLLDYLRKSAVAASEHGGITQHIGAFKVAMPSGRLVTFLDTPGHAAFLSMRARGANVTDIVILVVAADDSVKPQTLEAIKHAKDAGVPTIVAINKIDKPEANPQKVKQDLARHGIEVEDFGGDTQTVCVSGKTGQGLEDLEDATIALADILDVRADPEGQAEGWVLESSSKKGGKVATVLVRRGTLSPGDYLVAGTAWAKVRTLRNEAGAEVDAAPPGTPVEVDGWRQLPAAGAEAIQAESEQRARQVTELRLDREASARLADDVSALNESRASQRAAASADSSKAPGQAEEAESTEAGADASNKVRELPIVIRGDVDGSVEALTASLEALTFPDVRVRVLRASAGSVAPGDIETAYAGALATSALFRSAGALNDPAAASAAVVSFNGAPVAPALRLQAERAGVRVLEGNVIYRVVDAVRAALEDMLPVRVASRVLGEADVLTAFDIGVGGRRKVRVAGARVRNGVARKGGKCRILRKGKGQEGAGDVIYDGTLATLKSHKKDVNEMNKGTECGMGFDGFEDFQDGDQVQFYETFTERRKLQG